MSVADLTARGIRAMHANRGAGRPVCDGYEELAWVKVPRFTLKEEAQPNDPPDAGARSDL